MFSWTSSWTLLTYLLKATAWLNTTVKSLRNCSLLHKVSCERGLEVGETPIRGLEITVKALLSREASPDHVLISLV